MTVCCTYPCQRTAAGCPVCDARIPYTLPTQPSFTPMGCICPPTSEKTCENPVCPRKGLKVSFGPSQQHRSSIMTELAIGAVYETRTGPAEYRGLDHYHGETTHMFKDGQGVQYIKPGAPLDHHLNRGAPPSRQPDLTDVTRYSNNDIAKRMWESYNESGDRWFKYAAERLQTATTKECGELVGKITLADRIRRDCRLLFAPAEIEIICERLAAGQQSAASTVEPVALQVWYGPMPESNGKSNFTAILHKGELSQGHTIARSEYPDRVRYEADRVRWLIGELKEEPFVLDYDADKHSGYAAPTTSPEPDAVREIETAARALWKLKVGEDAQFDNHLAIKDVPGRFQYEPFVACFTEAKAVLAALSRPAHGGWEEKIAKIEAEQKWPAGCHSGNSCDRHQQCMYAGCRYEGKDIKADIAAAKAALVARNDRAPALDIRHFLCPACGSDMRNPTEQHKADCEFVAFVEAKKNSAALSDAVSGNTCGTSQPNTGDKP